MKLIDAESKLHFTPYTSDSEDSKIELTVEEILNKYTDEGCTEAYIPIRGDAAEWIPFDIPWYRCSNCGAVRENKIFMENFCSYCGADMRASNAEHERIR